MTTINPSAQCQDDDPVPVIKRIQETANIYTAWCPKCDLLANIVHNSTEPLEEITHKEARDAEKHPHVFH